MSLTHRTFLFAGRGILICRVDRLSYMKYLVKRWNGPFSIAIFLTNLQIAEVETWLKEYSSTPHLRVTLYIVDAADGPRKSE